MGLTFKENCPDLRNTKIVDVVSELKEYNMNVDITDPWCSTEQAEHEYGLSLIEEPKLNSYDAIILAVSHNEYRTMGVHLEKYRRKTNSEHARYRLSPTD